MVTNNTKEKIFNSFINYLNQKYEVSFTKFEDINFDLNDENIKDDFYLSGYYNDSNDEPYFTEWEELTDEEMKDKLQEYCFSKNSNYDFTKIRIGNNMLLDLEEKEMDFY